MARQENEYKPPLFLFNGHLETIFPALFRRVNVAYQRERLVTPDQDFLDLDWLRQGSDKLVVIQHGLEGNSLRAYIKGMANVFHRNGFDVLAWNYRGCSEEINKTAGFYHSGATDDLRFLIDVVSPRYKEVYLVGFSLGGNMTLKYLGEQPTNSRIKRAVVFSVPLHLESSCRKISQPENRLYAKRFLQSLKKKVRNKAKVVAGLDLTPLARIRSLVEFDDAYTAPLHGFANAVDYYSKCSALHFLDNIKVPTLIVNTLNDPFLSEQCFPKKYIDGHSFVNLEIHKRGGHVGFSQFNKNGVYWSEERALRWITQGR